MYFTPATTIAKFYSPGLGQKVTSSTINDSSSGAINTSPSRHVKDEPAPFRWDKLNNRSGCDSHNAPVVGVGAAVVVGDTTIPLLHAT